MELDRKSLQTPEINPLNITNDEHQKENRAADQFFSSLLESSRRLRGAIPATVRA
jgi:hypothetical protein